MGTLPEPRTLAGRYELRSPIAAGGMGRVWRGHDALLNRPVAVKVLRSEYTGDPTFLARFRAEAQHAALLAHRNIAAVHDYGEVAAAHDDGEEHLAFLVMELVEGEPLSTVLARERRLDVARTLDLLHQTAAGLAAAHAAGVVHRDVKPGNVLVGDDGVVKITDFGIAWSASDVPLTQTGQVVGTAHYLSPEQAEGGKSSPASDVYALGMIGYECLAGRRAFEGDNPVQIALRQLTDVPDPLPPHVPEPVRTLLGRALLKDPEERYPDGAAFRDAVADVLAGRELPPPVVPDAFTRPLGARPADPPAARSRGRRALAPMATLAAGVALGIGAVQLFGGSAPVVPRASGAVVAATPSPRGSAPHGATAALVVDPGDYLGRPVEQVRAELLARGLDVRLAAVPDAGVPAGEVTAVDPTGTLHPGDVVTVSYAISPAAGATMDPAAGSALTLATLVTATTPSAAPAEAAGPAQQPAPRPDPPPDPKKDHGHGKDHGEHGGGHGHGHK